MPHKMLLRFSSAAWVPLWDIKQFDNVFKIDEDFWHLQSFLWKEDLKANTPLLIAVIKTLINGNKFSASLFEEGMRILAEKVRPINPKPADFLLEVR